MNLAGVIAAVLAALFMGTMGLFSRKTGLDAELITCFRLFFGASFIGLVLLVRNRLKLLFYRPGVPLLASGAALSGFIIFYVQAMYLTTMANAIMVLYLAPLAASIIAHFFFNERLTLISTVLIGLALFGFAMMMEFHIDFSSGSNHMLGLGYAVLGMFCYATFILINRCSDASRHPLTRTFYQLMTGALCMLPFCIGSTMPTTSSNWLWVIGAGFFPGFLGIYLAVYALEKLPTAVFGTLAYSEPIFVVLIGWMVFGEAQSLLQLSGCGLIILSGIIQGIRSAQGGKVAAPSDELITPM